MLTGHGDDIHNYHDIKVNFSSNIYNHFNHEGLFKHLAEQMHRVCNYPDPTASALESALADHLGLKANNIIATNGATDAIYLIAQTWWGSTSFIIEPTFSEYADACLMHKHKVTYLHQIPQSTYGINMMWICCPNNPTGTVIDKHLLLSFIKNNPHTVFVIDASYALYTDQPLISAEEAAKLPNVIMLHSMTKDFGIPGLRLGYITANESLTIDIRQQQRPWSINALAQAAGIYLLQHKNEYRFYINSLILERTRVAEALQQNPNIITHPSHSHILLCKLRHGTAAQLKEHLATHHAILIRDASNFHTLTPAHFRIAIQSPQENNLLINALTSWSP